MNTGLVTDSGAERKIQTPSPTIDMVNKGVRTWPGTRARGIPASP